MILETSIQEVRDQADIYDVVQRYVDLKKKGANYAGCCPFHDENTPSFTVSPAKGMWHCFGACSTGGDAIKFIMEKERLDFIPAVKYLADWFNITLIETKKDEEPQETQVKRSDYLSINKAAARQYHKELLRVLKDEPNSPVAIELLQNRRLAMETIIDFQIGYAPATGRLLTPLLIERGLFSLAEDIGLVKKGENGNYDKYRDRIIFPIQNERGDITGFGARTMKLVTSSNPKYLNSSDSLIYNKSATLYGLYQGAKIIRKLEFAMLVEGYYDVTSFHQCEERNTVATGGTALTDGQCKMLKKHTNHVILIGDGDNAGNKANLKNVDLLLSHGFKVNICELPKGEDPDSFSRSINEVKEEVAA